MVGPSGAGKTTYLKDFDQSVVLSTDNIRSQICYGDFQDQSKNNQVFDILHRLVKANLDCGLDVVVDATNLRNKD
ncbi:ATP-binding protein, partial [Lactococcus petauri]|uniref:ATP-binding protein n=1 Tax=Lactococcus petauri TaxID=1940789 RepID=UPI0021F1A203